jgi:hypothetical protein
MENVFPAVPWPHMNIKLQSDAHTASCIPGCGMKSIPFLSLKSPTFVQPSSFAVGSFRVTFGYKSGNFMRLFINLSGISHDIYIICVRFLLELHDFWAVCPPFWYKSKHFIWNVNKYTVFLWQQAEI